MAKAWLWILSILLAGSLSLSGYLYFFGEGGESPEEDGGEEAAECEEDLSTFTGEEIKVSFDYPASWGETTETVTAAADSTEDVVSAGKTFQVTFSENPYLRISGASPDFESAGIGGVCPIRPYFNGEDMDYTCASLEDGAGENVGCDEAEIDGQDALSYYYFSNNECATLGFQKVLYAAIPDEQFPGMVMEMRIVAYDDLSRTEIGTRIAGGDAIGVSYLEGLISDIDENVETQLTSGTYADYLMNLQTDQIDALVESIQYTD